MTIDEGRKPAGAPKSALPKLAKAPLGRGTADATPFPNETPLPEKFGLHVKPIEPAHVLRGVGAVQSDGVHMPRLGDAIMERPVLKLPIAFSS